METMRLTINIPKDLQKAFKKIAVEEDTTMTDLIVAYIEKFVEDYEKTEKDKRP